MIQELNNKMIDTVAGGEICFCTCLNENDYPTIDLGTVTSPDDCAYSCYIQTNVLNSRCTDTPNTPIKKKNDNNFYSHRSAKVLFPGPSAA